MSITTLKEERNHPNKTPVIPVPIACVKCSSIYGQMYRVDKQDKYKGYICRGCK